MAIIAFDYIAKPLGYAGVTGSAANSLWLRQIGVGTSCTMTNAQLAVLNTTGVANSTMWTCGVELTNGSPVSSAYSLGALIGDAAYTPATLLRRHTFLDDSNG